MRVIRKPILRESGGVNRQAMGLVRANSKMGPWILTKSVAVPWVEAVTFS